MKNLIDQLNNVLTRNFDAIEGYDLAAENSDNPTMETFFKRHANTRRRFAEELANEIEILGGQPVDSGSFKASLHRTWMNIKDLISSNETEKMIEEAIRGEEAAIEEYNTILDNETPNPARVNEILRSQSTDVTSALTTLRGVLALVD